MGGIMSFIAPLFSVFSSFMKPSVPAPAPPPPPPPVQAPPPAPKASDSKPQADVNAERKRAAAARGLSGTNKTGGLGDTSTPNTQTKTLLGG